MACCSEGEGRCWAAVEVKGNNNGGSGHRLGGVCGGGLFGGWMAARERSRDSIANSSGHWLITYLHFINNPEKAKFSVLCCGQYDSDLGIIIRQIKKEGTIPGRYPNY